QFRDVVYKIARPEKTVLDGVSGTVRPGEMVALLGPSGSGKTTLLTALAGQLAVTGSVSYNDRPLTSAMRRRIAFVPQDDVLYPHLTVEETLLYTARLRLPAPLARTMARAVADQLGLGACRASLVGGPARRGVSGGERKRVSIGQELLVDPSLVLLDEPTSGLDSTTAARIVAALRGVARGGRTVVLTIHQPSSRVFYMFDRVLLLSTGRAVYYGEGSAAMGYFAELGLMSPSLATNPADFLLDLASGEIGALEKFAPAEAEEEEEEWATGWWVQFVVLLRRGMKERSHESLSLLRVSQVAASALLAGLLWWRSSGHLQDQAGLLFFMASFCGFFPLFEAIFAFPQERAVLAKERASRMYRLSAYFAARTAGDLPMELALPAALVASVYFMAGLRLAPAPFFQTLAAMLLGALVSQGLGLALGALVLDAKTAAALASVLMLAFMLGAGFFVQRLPRFVAWVRLLSPMYHLFRLALMAQLSPGDTYPCDGARACPVEEYPAVKAVGLRGGGGSVAALFAMLVVFRLVAYLGLTRVGRPR
ncbi:ABC transporter G family member 9-like, partial [Wolffia australiana]